MSKKSRLLIAKEKQWLGKRVKFYECTLYRDKRLNGPFYGIVKGICDDSAAEYEDLRRRIRPSGQLIVEEIDSLGRKREAWVGELYCTVMKEGET